MSKGLSSEQQFCTLRNTDRGMFLHAFRTTSRNEKNTQLRENSCKSVVDVRRESILSIRFTTIFHMERSFTESSLVTGLSVSLTAVQMLSWGHIKWVEPQPFGPIPSTSRCPATPLSAGSSATCCTKCCGVATEM